MDESAEYNYFKEDQRLSFFVKQSLVFLNRWKGTPGSSKNTVCSLLERSISQLLEGPSPYPLKSASVTTIKELEFLFSRFESRDHLDVNVRRSLLKILYGSLEDRIMSALRGKPTEMILANLADIFLKEFLPDLASHARIPHVRSNFLSMDDLGNKVVSRIEFPPHLRQAGISVLHHFSDIIDSKYPDHSVSITIEQNGDKVTMTISSPDGEELEKVTETLSDYMQVVSGKKKPEELLSDPLAILRLENKILNLTTEIKMNEKIMLRDQRDIGKLQQIVDDQKEMIATLILQNQKKDDQLDKRHDTLVSQLQVKDERELMLLSALQDSLEKLDEDNARLQLEQIKNSHKGLLSRLVKVVGNGVLGNKATDFLEPIFKKLN